VCSRPTAYETEATGTVAVVVECDLWAWHLYQFLSALFQYLMGT
jgi:hypothetical protein